MAPERGGKYLHLNARSIPPFRRFFSRYPLLRLAVSPPFGIAISRSLRTRNIDRSRSLRYVRDSPRSIVTWIAPPPNIAVLGSPPRRAPPRIARLPPVAPHRNRPRHPAHVRSLDEQGLVRRRSRPCPVPFSRSSPRWWFRPDDGTRSSAGF